VVESGDILVIEILQERGRHPQSQTEAKIVARGKAHLTLPSKN